MRKKNRWIFHNYFIVHDCYVGKLKHSTFGCSFQTALSTNDHSADIEMASTFEWNNNKIIQRKLIIVYKSNELIFLCLQQNIPIFLESMWLPIAKIKINSRGKFAIRNHNYGHLSFNHSLFFAFPRQGCEIRALTREKNRFNSL